MQLLNGKPVYSASDLNNFLECAHTTDLDGRAMRGEIEIPTRSDHADMIARYGDEHERAYLDSLTKSGAKMTKISRAHGRAELESAAQQTRDAMAAGESLIYQATFFDGKWLGHADLLRRIEARSKLGDWSYEVVDAKLARTAKPYFVLQLCFYSEQLAVVQGTDPVEMFLYLGTKEEVPYKFASFEAYYRRVKNRFLEYVGSGAETYPYPVAHCGICRWNDVCTAKRIDDDHPSQTAFIRRDQIERLAAANPPMMTMSDLAAASVAMRPAKMAQTTFEKLVRQATLQRRVRAGGKPKFDFLPPAASRGFDILPPSSEGDIFFDMEGDPFIGGGLEYLFGVITVDLGKSEFRSYWADNAAEEKTAFEQFMDFVAARRKRYPDLHIYHYAHYEPTALKKLMIRHSTREDDVDDLLRNNVFIDLYKVVRQGLIVPGYSIKDVEAFYWPGGRTDEVKDALGSIVAFEGWRNSKDAAEKQAFKNQILKYNQTDCESTRLLLGWLRSRRDEVWAKYGNPPPTEPREVRELKEETAELRSRQDDLAKKLRTGVPVDPKDQTPDQTARWLLANLMAYHRREDKPAWWEFFDRVGQSTDELVEDNAAIGDLTPHQSRSAHNVKKSTQHYFEFPPQEYRIKLNSQIFDEDGNPAGKVTEIDDETGALALLRGPSLSSRPLPRAIIPRDIISATPIEKALCRFAEEALISSAAATRYAAGRAILFRDIPTVTRFEPGSRFQDGDISLEAIKAIVAGLDRSYLFIQGPPGSGKTYTGARLIVELLQNNKRVGVSAHSHKAIDNLLHEVEKVAEEQRVRFRGHKKIGSDEGGYLSKSSSPQITETADADACADLGIRLIAGTAWLFTRPEFENSVDVLFIDEAGQVGLANALAMSTAAESVVLLGDPLQLSQVSRGAQPEGAEVSVLEHLLGKDATIPPNRGVFLTRSWRMHPTICDFISRVVYDNRLKPEPGNERQRIAAAGLNWAGLKFWGVEHGGEAQRSADEAAAVCAIAQSVLGGRVTDRQGNVRSIQRSDLLVITPYNAQVRTIKEILFKAGMPDIRVGTVDKFQGQEAPIVIFSMATPTGDQVPRGLEFLFSQNRLNVAISRAKCWSIIVACPRLLDSNCRTVEQMRLVNTLCLFEEAASPGKTTSVSVSGS
jgi:uncharacterized protein